MHAPTEEQAAFRKASVALLEAPRGIIKSTAGAGCGKTTALKGAVQDCNRAGASRLLVLSYTKQLVSEVQGLFGNLAVVRTFNSLALEAVGARSEGRTIGQLYPSHVLQAFDLHKKKLPIDAQAFAKVIIGTVSKYLLERRLNIISCTCSSLGTRTGSSRSCRALRNSTIRRFARNVENQATPPARSVCQRLAPARMSGPCTFRPIVPR